MTGAYAIVEPPKAQTSAINEQLIKTYKKNTSDYNVIEALELLKDTTGEYSRKAILGENLTQKPVKIEFRDLAAINPAYANFDALGWKKNKNSIFISIKNIRMPPKKLLRHSWHMRQYIRMNLIR